MWCNISSVVILCLNISLMLVWFSYPKWSILISCRISGLYLSVTSLTKLSPSSIASDLLPFCLFLFLIISRGLLQVEAFSRILCLHKSIHSIRKPKECDNVVVIKLDIAKAYDRVSWTYICLVLRVLERLLLI